VKHILVVDDEPQIAGIARDYLERAGYRVTIAGDGADAVAKARAQRPDLIVLDLALPQMDGLDVTRAIRRDSNVPIIMLTARVDESDKLIGLELGADDYVTKPFSPPELVARVRAILRRTTRDARRPSAAPLAVGGLVLDPTTHEVRLNGRLIDLTTKEFDLLQLLLGHPSRVFTRDFLLEHIWGYDYFGSTRTVDMHISRLREKIEDDPNNPTYITTVRGVGYKLKKDPG